MIRSERIKILNSYNKNHNGKYVLYMMQASQRINYNHALYYALNEANRLNKPLLVGFSIMPYFPNANTRHYEFMIEGVYELISEFKKMGIKFVVKFGKYEDIFQMLSKDCVVAVIDKGYLKFQKEIRNNAIKKLKIKVIEIEGDVVVPVLTVSSKKEPYARTIRNKILSKIDYFIEEDITLPKLLNKNYSNIKLESDFKSLE